MRQHMVLAALLFSANALQAAPKELKFRAVEIDPHVGNVCYALTLADVNGDGRLDIVAVTENAVVWYENPTWRKRIIVENQTERDNVCIAAHDINGDAKVDFALGASWQPTNTQSGGTLEWLERGRSLDEPWLVHPIASEPTLHRIRWGDVLGTGSAQLVMAPLQGRGTRGPNWNDGPGARLLVFSVPKDPIGQPWPSELIDDSLHTLHNLWISDCDGNGRNDVLTASWEGVHRFERLATGQWLRQQLGEGNQKTAPPQRGSSEIKPGRLPGGKRYLATIEPWHGFQVVIYTEPTGPNELWRRHVIDEAVQWGHAVWTADLDGNDGDELVIGQRDKGTGSSAGPGVFVYRARNDEGTDWEKIVVDDGGVATEDMVAGDLNGDGRIDLVAGGRATHNIKLYENIAPRE